jgi:hypothetical protein
VVAKSEASLKLLPFGKVVAKTTYRMGDTTAKKPERTVALPETTLETVWFSVPPRTYR